MRDEFAVELCKPVNFCNILDELRLRPVFKKLMLWHGRTISVWTDINTNKLEMLGKDATLAQAQWESVGLAEVKLTFYVWQCLFKWFRQAENVVNNGFGICIVINDKIWLLGKGFPLAVNGVNESDKQCWSVCWSKWHDDMCPLDGIWALEC